jgi:hypothetical protein
MDGAAARSQQSATNPNADALPLEMADDKVEESPAANEEAAVEQAPGGLAAVPSTDDGPRLRVVESAPEAAEPELSPREREILGFERQWWKYAGAKEEAIKATFGMSATRYYQVLNALVDRPEALRADPMLVKRLRRLRAGRQKARAARRLGFTIT